VIKAGAKTPLGEPVLLLGLSGENVARLAAGEPILITQDQLEEIGCPRMIIIIDYGRRERDILAKLKKHGITLKPAD
jgi:hypothetical protein